MPGDNGIKGAKGDAGIPGNQGAPGPEGTPGRPAFGVGQKGEKGAVVSISNR
jgi:hypothetical protein